MKAIIKETGKVIEVEPLFYSEIGFTNPMIHKNRIEIIEQSPWISVKEKLPETDNGKSLYEVLTQTSDGRFTVFVNIQIESLADRGEVINWMPIPSFGNIIEANKNVLKRIKKNLL